MLLTDMVGRVVVHGCVMDAVLMAVYRLQAFFDVLNFIPHLLYLFQSGITLIS